MEPGSVSLLGVLHDIDGEVEVLIDEDLWKGQYPLCHPLVSTSTLSLGREELVRIFQLSGHFFRLLNIPELEGKITSIWVDPTLPLEMEFYFKHWESREFYHCDLLDRHDEEPLPAGPNYRLLQLAAKFFLMQPSSPVHYRAAVSLL